MTAIGKVVHFTKICRLGVVNQWHCIDFVLLENKLTHKVLYTKIGYQASRYYLRGNIVML